MSLVPGDWSWLGWVEQETGKLKKTSGADGTDSTRAEYSHDAPGQVQAEVGTYGDLKYQENV